MDTVSTRKRKERHRAVPLLPEVRFFAAEGLEVRSSTTTDEIVISGSPIVYGVDYQVRDMLGVFTERMAEGVATDVLTRGADVRFLFNHDGLPLARSTSGTMTLTDGVRSLDFEARLDARQQLANDLAIAVERGDVNQMSCGFIVAEDQWNDDWDDRTVLRFEELLDVSAVTYPASPTTTLKIAQRMALDVPVQSRARVRKAALEARGIELHAGKVLSADNQSKVAAALKALNSLAAAADMDPEDLVEQHDDAITGTPAVDGTQADIVVDPAITGDATVRSADEAEVPGAPGTSQTSRASGLLLRVEAARRRKRP